MGAGGCSGIPSGCPAQRAVTAAGPATVLGVAIATDTRAVGAAAAIAIGGRVRLDALFGGPVTGASMNPARSFGPALAAGERSQVWVYLAGPLAGALLGAFAYQLVRGTPARPSPAPQPPEWATKEPSGRGGPSSIAPRGRDRPPRSRSPPGGSETSLRSVETGGCVTALPRAGANSVPVETLACRAERKCRCGGSKRNDWRNSRHFGGMGLALRAAAHRSSLFQRLIVR
jgi:hypothetical protein